jgi:hypothetical protein
MKIIFFHIPKTAGTALVSGLHNAFFDIKNPFRRYHFSVCPRASLSKNREQTFSDRITIAKYGIRLNGVSLVTGHIPYFEVDEALKNHEEWKSLTVLRDPVKRFISEYYYNKRKASNHFKINTNLDDYLASESAVFAGQTYLKWFSPEGDLEVAKLNIEQINIIGFQENLGKLTEKLIRDYNLRIRLKKTNKRPSKLENETDTEISDTQMNRIRELCKKDTQLYEYFSRNQTYKT